MIRDAKPIVVLHVTPEGEESELEKLLLDPGGPYLKDVVDAQIAKGRKYLILDLTFVPHLDSYAIGEIVSAFVHAGRLDGGLVLACLSPMAHKVLRIMNLEEVIPNFASVAAAVEHYCA